MTREEAIRTLKEHKITFQHDNGWDTSTLKAIDMAIEALSAEPCEDCRTCNKWSECECGEKGHKNGTSMGYSARECKDYEPCEDAISRQSVLDAIHLFFTEEVDKIPTRKSEDGEVYDIHKCQPLLEMNKELCKRIKALCRK